MPQQINLSTPVLLAQKRYFSAQTMVLSLLVFLVAGLAMTAYGLWSLHGVTGSLQSTLATRQPELTRVRDAVARVRADAGADDKQINQQLQAARVRLIERQQVLAELQHGLLAPGRGHSARMQLLARTIPAQAWITAIQADATQLEVRGFTQEPAVLNDWVGQLARSPVLAGQQLSRVKVERAPGDRPLWSFSLGSVAGAREARP